MTETSWHDMTLGDIGDGALEVRFQRELQRVVENIDDPNTGEEAREITIKVRCKPIDDRREQVAVEATVTSKLSAYRPAAANAFLVRENGKLKVREWNPRQERLPMPGERINVVDLNRNKETPQ